MELKPRNPHLPDSYTEQFSAITTAGISPENMHLYADVALDRLITLIESAVGGYRVAEPNTANSGIDEERAALRYMQLDPETIENTLDRIADLSQTIQDLEGLIQDRITCRSTMAVPPNANKKPMTFSGDGAFEANKLFRRTEMILLLASQLTDLDLQDDDAWSIEEGTISQTAMRHLSNKSTYCGG